jgi:hypothetical protein
LTQVLLLGLLVYLTAGWIRPHPPDRPDLAEHRQGIGHRLNLAALPLQSLDADLGRLHRTAQYCAYDLIDS